MDGTPLHPALVHFPLGIAIVLPIVTFVLAVAIWRNLLPHKAWWLVVILQVAQIGGGIASLKTGEKEEVLVGGIVDDEPVETHSAYAHQFMYGVGGLFVLALGVALIGGRKRKAGLAGYAVVTLASAAVLGLGMRAGHAGGLLVYKHGAAAAHLPDDAGGDDGDDDKKKHDED